MIALPIMAVSAIFFYGLPMIEKYRVGEESKLAAGIATDTLHELTRKFDEAQKESGKQIMQVHSQDLDRRQPESPLNSNTT